ncbi:MAG TPA: MarR family transcriptional regulator [Candidatus Deferrimicrobium sp.]|nr:MarR family transcriptional regulator [Candidatus Deferrimicrobium sp.]
MNDQDVVSKVEILLRHVAVAVTHRGREHLGDYQITPPQFSALLALIDSGEITMGELCQKLFLACSTVTDLIDRMEKNGYVERFKDSKDRRVIRLRVLPAGIAVYEDVIKNRKTYLKTVLAQISDEQQQNLVASLESLHSLMKPEHK